MIQFKVNELITVKLENEKTVIYIANDRSWHCKYLLLSIPIKDVSSFDEIESIDEAAELLDKRLDFEDVDEEDEDEEEEFTTRRLIPPHVEFWAHCSNLQVWAENEYNTQLLHSNLAFPLLRKLYFSNDPIAKNVFKKEIAKRLESGFPPVVEFLVLQKYLDYLSDDEFSSVIQNPKVIDALVRAGYKNEEDEYQYDGLYELIRKMKKKQSTYLKTLIGELLKSNNLELLCYLERTNLMYELNITELAYKLLIPEEAKAVVEIQKILQNEIGFSIGPEYRGAPISVEEKHVVALILSYSGLSKIPNQVFKFKKLRELYLTGNLLTTLPDSIEDLTEIRHLGLSKNKISTISKTIGELQNLQYLNLSSNLLEHLPNSIGNLKSLKKLNVSDNPLKTIPDFLTKLSNINIIFYCENRSCVHKLPHSHLNFTYPPMITQIEEFRRGFTSNDNDILNRTKSKLTKIIKDFIFHSKTTDTKFALGNIRFFAQLFDIKEVKDHFQTYLKSFNGVRSKVLIQVLEELNQHFQINKLEEQTILELKKMVLKR